ncbi:MAG: CCA tRNA nucleotidyltransferase [Clostridia bacterium]
MTVSTPLEELANLFPTPLYIVGGAVRDFVAGFPVSDIDLAASLKPDELIAILKDSNFKVSPTSLKLGTLKIRAKNESYEYTSFRTDSYPLDGSHRPSDVKFTKEIKEDALRRDFTINAVYYHIKTQEFVDLCGGIPDIKNRLIRTTAHPEKVLKEDALRVLRGIRIAAQTGFEIENKTFAALAAYASGLKNIAAERIREEFDKIIIADTHLGIKDGHIRGLRLLDEIGALKYIVPELLEGKGVLQRADFHKYDVFGHALSVFEAAPPEIRLAALLHDIAKPATLRKTGRFAGHDKAGAEMAVNIMRRLVYPEAEIRRVKKLIAAHMYDLDNKTGEKKLRLFILEHCDIIEDLIKLKRADIAGGGIIKEDVPLRLEETYHSMLNEGVAFSIKALPISGRDLLELDIPANTRGALLGDLLKRSVNDSALRTREAALNFAKKYK